MMTRTEHLEFCKKRALEYASAGNLLDAVASMGSDLQKHPDTAAPRPAPLMWLGMQRAIAGDAAGVEAWINGFR